MGKGRSPSGASSVFGFPRWSRRPGVAAATRTIKGISFRLLGFFVDSDGDVGEFRYSCASLVRHADQVPQDGGWATANLTAAFLVSKTT